MVVDLSWKDRCLTDMTVHPRLDGDCRIMYPTITADCIAVTDGAGNPVATKVESADILSFPMTAGGTYTISGIPAYERSADPVDLQVNESDPAAIGLRWTAAEPDTTYTVYRALGSAPDYEVLTDGLATCHYTDTTKGDGQATYKVVATAPGKVPSLGVLFTVLPAGVERREIVFGAGAGKPAKW